MEIKEGFSYHIKNDFYIKVSDEKLMRNKENGIIYKLTSKNNNGIINHIWKKEKLI